jgi:uncharacterized protein
MIVRMSLYGPHQRELQDRFDTRRLADRLEERNLRETIDAGDRDFIEARDMFFLATTGADGVVQCSYKGGEPGFVRVLDERTIAFPSYDGNGMYLSMGNVLVNHHVGLLFINFQERKRLRLNGVASIDEDDPLMGDYPEAQFVVRVRAEQVFPNCPRYIHHYELVQRSSFVPKSACETPVPAWKTREWSRDALPENDPARNPARQVVERG